MANTTFNGPVRSENGFKTIIKNSTTGALTNEMTLSTYSTSITIAASGTGTKNHLPVIPSNFIPMGVAITITIAAANAVNPTVDIGTDADTDGFVDGSHCCYQFNRLLTASSLGNGVLGYVWWNNYRCYSNC